MASIQMPLEAAEKAEDVELQTTANHLVIFEEAKPMPPTSVPTSVIVTSRPCPKPVTQSLLRKEGEMLVESPLERINAVDPTKSPKASTVNIFGADKVEQKTTPTVTTSKFFVPGQVITDTQLASKKSSEQPLPLGSKVESSSLEEERKFFEMLFDFDTSNLEQLAPHNGMDCVDLSNQASKVTDASEQVTTANDMKTNEYKDLLGSVIDLSEIENFCGLISAWSPTSTGSSEETTYAENWSPVSRFDLTETPLLRPEEDIMWGMSSQSKNEEDLVIVGDVTKKDGTGGGTRTEEPPRCRKRNLFEMGGGAEPPEKVRIVQNTGDFSFLLISQ